jgi:hypothetical protein
MIPLSQLIRSTRYVGPEDPGHADVASGRGELGRRSLKRALALLFCVKAIIVFLVLGNRSLLCLLLLFS